jgi:hypothetical protein
MSVEVFMATRTHIADLLGVSPLSKLDMAEKIENGLSLDQVQRLRDAGLTFSEVASWSSHLVLSNTESRVVKRYRPRKLSAHCV